MSSQPCPVIYPAPEEEVPAADFTLTVDGQPVFTHQARVSACPMNQVWPGYQRPREQTEIASFASWDMAAPVEVVVVSARPVQQAAVRPRSAGITPRVEGDTIRFTVARPGSYTVEVNGTHRALHLFASPPEVDVPDPRDPNVISFGPGVHCPGLVRLTSGQTVHIAGGAVVYGAFFAGKAADVAIRGRGILDGSRFDRMALTALIGLHDCENVRIEGIILRDSGGFNIAPIACRQVHIRNVKLIGNWRYNSDGIDFISCQDCRVEDSFLRTFDDGLCVKGYESFGPFIYRLQLVDGQWDGTFSVGGDERRTFAEFQRRFGIFPTRSAPVHGIHVRRCVIWCDWGRALEVGAETAADEIRDVRFEDCDIIHCVDVAMDVQNCDRALCRDIVFRDIRVEMDDAPMAPFFQSHRGQVYPAPAGGHLPHLIVLEIKKGYCSFDAVRGRIEDVRFETIAVTAPAMPPSRLSGHDAEHGVKRVAIENLRLNGQPVDDVTAGNISVNEFVREVTVRAGVPRILFLGNSITLHGPKADIGWTGNWGMAASAPEKDYAHRLLRRFAAETGGVPPEALIENVADFERAYRAGVPGDKIASWAGFGADIVVLAIGENVPALATPADQADFRAAVVSLLARLTRGRKPALYVRSCFWPDPAKDDALRLACRDAVGRFVDISLLGKDEKNYARAEREFSYAGVGAHPGDAGMAAIADALWSAMHG